MIGKTGESKGVNGVEVDYPVQESDRPPVASADAYVAYPAKTLSGTQSVLNAGLFAPQAPVISSTKESLPVIAAAGQPSQIRIVVDAAVEKHSGVRPVWNEATQSYKPPFLIIPKENVEVFVYDLLRTPLLKQNAQEQGTLFNKIIQNLAQVPLLIHLPSNDPIERLNFTSWMRVLMVRAPEYENGVFSDLYLLHELNHMTSMPYGAYPIFDDWADKMRVNEKLASCVSEAFIYFAIPELRSQMPFPEIWVDRFLKNEERLNSELTNQELYTQDPKAFLKLLFEKFTEIDKKPHDILDAMERRTASYTSTVVAWNEIYRGIALDIDKHMVDFLGFAKSDPEAAANLHFMWASRHSTNGVLFADQAKEFLKTYKGITGTRSPELTSADLEARLWSYAHILRARREEGLVTPTDLLIPTEELLGYGIVPTVYAMPWKESKRVTIDVAGQMTAGELYEDLYGLPYLRRQDTYHVAFLDEFIRWSSPVVKGLEEYAFRYGTNGSSEAIKDSLTYLLKVKNPNAALHVFAGEYEGAIYLASKGLETRVVQHPRTKETLEKIDQLTQPGDFFYISEPSALDGNLWTDYDHFLEATRAAKLQLMVDLCYVGCFSKDHQIDVSAPHIRAAFFSLSKSMGVYYQRTGGAFFREENPLLTGNIWFKNVLSQRIGLELMQHFDVHYFPNKYESMQKSAIGWANDRLPVKLAPSDVVLLAHQSHEGGREAVADLRLKPLYRGMPSAGYIRACLTPHIDTMLNPHRRLPMARMGGGVLPRGLKV